MTDDKSPFKQTLNHCLLSTFNNYGINIIVSTNSREQYVDISVNKYVSTGLPITIIYN